MRTDEFLEGTDIRQEQYPEGYKLADRNRYPTGTFSGEIQDIRLKQISDRNRYPTGTDIRPEQISDQNRYPTGTDIRPEQ